MRSKAKLFAIIAVVAIIWVSMTGCATTEPFPSRFPVISDYTFIPSKDYTVVGAVVIRDVQHRTMIADLMDRAIAIGGHDIINVRVDWRHIPGRQPEINTATAVVIRYTERTLVEESTTTSSISPGGAIQTTRSGNSFVGNTGSSGASSGDGNTNIVDDAMRGARGFLGRGR
ncbi:MAG: hypothetical protein FWD87_04920 [Spirochaetaceae bacterium]|nr:hypothetical protein [Spirochaetaceae bacterium]